MDITDKVQASQILTENVPASEWADITIDGKIYAGFNKLELHIVVNLSRKLLIHVFTEIDKLLSYNSLFFCRNSLCANNH